MEKIKTMAGMLALITSPAFLVDDGTIKAVNKAAAARLIHENTPVDIYLTDAKEEYAAFSEGSMQLNFVQAGITTAACVTRIDGIDVFVLETSACQESLQAFSTAAQHLRRPLADIFTISDQLLLRAESGTKQEATQKAHLKKSLLRIQRMLNNMSDAAGYCASGVVAKELTDLTAFFQELIDKAGVYIQRTGRTLLYAAPSEKIIASVDRQKLERAVYNLIANAIHYSPAESTIRVSLSKLGKTAAFTVLDEGRRAPMYENGDICQHFMRSAAIEDGSDGLGLGLYIVRSVAQAHGGSLLSTFSEQEGNKITMTLSTQDTPDALLRSNVVYVDYSGGQDPALLEFSDVLPPESFL